MKIDSFDCEEKVLVIAEIGNNHEGSVDHAKTLIDLAVGAGADAVKFQTFVTEQYVNAEQTERVARLRSFELTPDDFHQLSEHTKQHDALFISTPLDLDSANALAPLVSAYKIGSSDTSFYPLLRTVARNQKPVILSTGLTQVGGIAKAVSCIEEVWKAHSYDGDLGILHCVTAYPCPPDQANVRAVQTLQHHFDHTIGYSDHVLGNEACLLAVTLGARIIEKHFTSDKNYSEFRDHHIAADPPELTELVKRIREATKLLGSGKKVLQPNEKEVVDALRRSLTAKFSMVAGHTLTLNDVCWTRPGVGLRPGEEEKVLGKTLTHNISAGQRITEFDLQ